MSYFIGVDGVAKEVSNIAVGVDGVARNVKYGYIGVDGKARLFFAKWHRPSVNETIVSLGQGETYNTDTVFAPGRYEIQIAGAPTTEPTFDKNNCFSIQTVVEQPFTIIGITSTSATDSFLTSLGIISEEGTIFGGSGGASAGTNAISYDDPAWKQGSLTHGGACCHFLPVNGVFGTDYLRCFHCGAPADGGHGGSGAYGGGAGGRGSGYVISIGGPTFTRQGSSGCSGAGGQGGVGGVGGTGQSGRGYGINGIPGGMGGGYGGGLSDTSGVIWYDGTYWIVPTRSTNTSGSAYIRVIYRGE